MMSVVINDWSEYFLFVCVCVGGEGRLVIINKDV